LFALQTDRLHDTIHGTMANSSSKKRPSQYQSFDPIAKKIRDAAIKSLADICLEHSIANGGKCKRNLM
jgi:hypothetical protein